MEVLRETIRKELQKTILEKEDTELIKMLGLAPETMEEYKNKMIKQLEDILEAHSDEDLEKTMLNAIVMHIMSVASRITLEQLMEILKK